jgi:hypothetical protein
MAGSYKHIVDENGAFRGVELLDHLGDAYEALQECYGMIMFLAFGDLKRVEQARQHYEEGLELGAHSARLATLSRYKDVVEAAREAVDSMGENGFVLVERRRDKLRGALAALDKEKER